MSLNSASLGSASLNSASLNRANQENASMDRASLAVDWIRCTAHGLCAEIAPELVTLDDWGYPMVAETVPPHLEALAARARAACPAMALRLSST